MIVITTPTFDINAPLVLHHTETSDFGSLARRVSRSKTLDGGVVIQDRGFTDCDRTVTIIAKRMTQSEEKTARSLFKNYPLLILGQTDGLYSVAPVTLTTTGDQLTLRLFVTAKISEV